MVLKMNQNLEDQKTITIAKEDRGFWYSQREATAHISVSTTGGCPGFIIVFIDSIDDFSMRYQFEILYDEKAAYEHVKKYIYDRIPKDVTMDWLLEHSFIYI